MKTVSLLAAGSNNHAEAAANFNALGTDFIANGVVGAITNTSGIAPMTGAFGINAQATPNMTVQVSAGTAYVTGTPAGSVSQVFRCVDDTGTTVTIASNNTGGTRYDHVYISLDATKLAAPAADASDVLTFVASRSTSASVDNGTPPAYGYKLGVVTVANLAATITNANIADSRTQSGPNALPQGSTTTTGMNMVSALNLATNAIFLGSASVTASQVVTSNLTDVDLTGLTITVTIPTGGRTLILYAYGTFDCATSTTLHRLKIKEGSTVLQSVEGQEQTVNIRRNLHCLAVVSAPTAGSHTYKATYNNNQPGGANLYADAVGNKAIIVGILV